MVGTGEPGAEIPEQHDHQQLNGHVNGSPTAAVRPRDVPIASAKPLDFRILTEPIALRPSKGAYGVPYDLVDTSQGSAMSEMLQQLREADTALAAMNILNHSVKPEE